MNHLALAQGDDILAQLLDFVHSVFTKFVQCLGVFNNLWIFGQFHDFLIVGIHSAHLITSI